MSLLNVVRPTPTAEQFVPAPAGSLPISTVHRIPPGGRVAHIGDEIHLIDAEGNTIHKATREDQTIPNTRQEESQTYAVWKHTGSPPIQKFKTTWTVPLAPTTDNGQSIGLFIATKTAESDSFLEAVLQWGPSGIDDDSPDGHHWRVFSYYSGGWATRVSPVTKVAVGDSLEAVINLTRQNDTSFDYTCGFSGIPESFITVTGAREQAKTVVELQINRVTQPSDYPIGNTTFKNICVSLTDSTYPSLTWSTVDNVADGLSTTVDVDGSRNGQVTVNHQAK